MSVGDVFLLVVRWLHLLAAVAWMGGCLFYLLVLRPVLSRFPSTLGSMAAFAGREFRFVSNTCIVVLIATGVILAFDRLTEGFVDVPYAATLGLKSVLTIWMFLIAWSERRQVAILEGYYRNPPNPTMGFNRIGNAASRYNILLILGITVLFLSDLMKVLFESAFLSG